MQQMFDFHFQISQIPGFIFNLIYLILVIGTIVVVVLDNRNPVKTIAWVLVLLFLPLVGLIFYFFFGRGTRRERIINQKSYDRLLKKPIAAYQSYQSEDYPEKYETLIKFFWNTNQSIPFLATEIDIYTNGYTKIKALLREIGKAKRHIHIEYFIFMDDAVGRLVRDALIDKAKEGVEVRVIYDDVGSWQANNEFYEQMRDAGIEVRGFMKVRFPLFTSKVNYRNHRKIVVIDGSVGFVGGMNLANRYVQGLKWGCWRDTHILLRGRAVHGLQTAFLLDWYFVDQTLLTSSKYFAPIAKTGSILTQIVTSDPVGPVQEIMQGLMQLITTARQYVYIQTPYFLPSEGIQLALKSAAQAGVDVRLMLPKQSDSLITQWCSFSYVRDMLEGGVKVYFYTSGFLHAKTVVCDDSIATVGSTNIDFRSFEHNFEVNAFIYDVSVSLTLKEVFLQDQHESIQLTLKTWDMRPIWRKVLESIVRLLAPLL